MEALAPAVDTRSAAAEAHAPLREGSAVRDVAGTYGVRLANISLSMINGVVTARMLGPHDRGIFALVYMFASTVVTFVKLGMAQSNVYSIRRERIAPERVAANALFASIAIGATSALLVWLIRGSLLGTFLRGVPEWALLVSLPLIPVLLFESYFFAILQAMGMFGLYNRRMLVGSLILCAGLFVSLVVLHAGLAAAIVVISFNPVLMNAWLLFTVRRMMPLSLNVDRALLRRQVRFGLKSHVQVLAQHLHLRSDTYLVAFFLSPSQVAFYVIAVRLAELILDIPRIVGMVLYPRLAALDDHAMHRLAAQACRRTVLITAVLGALLSLLGPYVIVLWYGHEYAKAGGPLPYIATGIVMLSVLISLTQSFTSRDRQQVNIAASSIALAGNVLLNIFLIPRFGIVGAGMSSAISYAAAASFLLIFFLRKSGLAVQEVLLPQREDFVFFARMTKSGLDRLQRRRGA